MNTTDAVPLNLAFKACNACSDDDERGQRIAVQLQSLDDSAESECRASTVRLRCAAIEFHGRSGAVSGAAQRELDWLWRNAQLCAHAVNIVIGAHIASDTLRTSALRRTTSLTCWPSPRASSAAPTGASKGEPFATASNSRAPRCRCRCGRRSVCSARAPVRRGGCARRRRPGGEDQIPVHV